MSDDKNKNKEILLNFVKEIGEDIYELEEKELLNKLSEKGFTDEINVKELVNAYETYRFNDKVKEVIEIIFDKFKQFNFATYFDDEETTKKKLEENEKLENEIFDVLVKADFSKIDFTILKSYLSEIILGTSQRIDNGIHNSYSQLADILITKNIRKTPTLKEMVDKVVELDLKNKNK